MRLVNGDHADTENGLARSIIVDKRQPMRAGLLVTSLRVLTWLGRCGRWFRRTTSGSVDLRRGRSPCSGLMQPMEPSHGFGVPVVGRLFVPGGSDHEILTDAATGSIEIAELKLGLGQTLLGRR